MKQAKQYVAIALLLLLCIVVYWNSLHGEFQFDDDHLIRFNFSLRNFWDWKGIAASEKFRPLTMMTFAFNYSIGQQNTFSYHLTNLILHMVTVWLFLLLLKRHAVSLLFAFFSAALFALHPLNSEAVAYISSRSILLCAVFVLASILSFDSYVRTKKVKFAVGFFLFFLLGALAREEAALIPFLALIYDFVFF
ncbi:MAG TPA: hypothetical protein VJ521_09540, partial [Acidobacteriota bacterium]|nr:hypothetical protein [Acidobacteriota bacterium]